MTKEEQEKITAELMAECLGIYMLGTLEELKEKIKVICNKYFPKCSVYIINNCCEYFFSLRMLNYSFYDLTNSINYYFNKKHK